MFSALRLGSPPAPPDDRSRLEKMGVVLKPEAASTEPGRDWAWVVGQFEGARFWGKPLWTVRIRRKVWPVAYFGEGLLLPAGDGATSRVDKPFRKVWHAWRRSDVGDQSTLVGGMIKGFGGVVGADWDADQFVMVCGQREYDGTSYRPTADDLAATDWERIHGDV